MNPGSSYDLNPASGQSLTGLMAVFLLLAWLVWAPAGRAQTDSDVHIMPRSSSNKPSEAKSAESVANSSPDHNHGKPLLSKVDLVLVPVTVTDPMNRAVLGLEKKNFEVYEDGSQQEIQNISSDDAPLALGVIFDTSKSMSNKIETARESVAEFFKAANPEDDFFLITFSDRPQLLVDFTTSVEDIQKRLMYALPQGHTSLLDAIYMGLSKIRRSRYQRRALLIISDGGDNRSRYTSSEIKRVVEEADVQLYGIGIFDSVFQTPEERAGRQLLDHVTEATGGHTVAVKDVQELPQAANRIALELRNQYVVGYRSTNPARDGKWRKIKVKIVPPPGMRQLHVYAKSGYYSPVE